MVTVSIRAHAKINLDLRVLGMRTDGFHELRTVFQALALHDTIRCIPREGPFAIECATAGVPLDRTNLIWRAAETLWRSLRRSGPVRDVVVQLEKQIPLQAGLGGGSADAAAALMALAHAWRVPMKPSQLTDVAAHIGSDVPFFLSGGTALGLGRGEEIYPLADLPRHWIVLLDPRLRRVDERGVRLVRLRARAVAGAAGGAARPRSVAVARRADDQRSRGADRASSPGDRPDEGGAPPRRSAGCCDVGQRLDGFRPVSEAARCRRRPSSA